MEWPDLLKLIYEKDSAFYSSAQPGKDSEKLEELNQEGFAQSALMKSSPELKSAAVCALLFSTADRAASSCRVMIDNFFSVNEVSYRSNPPLFLTKMLALMSDAEWNPNLYIIAEPNDIGIVYRVVFYPFGYTEDRGYFFMVIKPREGRETADPPVLPHDWRVPELVANMMEHFLIKRENPDRNIMCSNYTQPTMGRELFRSMRVAVFFMFISELTMVLSDSVQRKNFARLVAQMARKAWPSNTIAVEKFEEIFISKKSEERKEVDVAFKCLVLNSRPWLQSLPLSIGSCSEETPRSPSPTMPTSAGTRKTPEEPSPAKKKAKSRGKSQRK